MDIAVLQPIFDLDSRKELHTMYSAGLDKNTFSQLMDEIVVDEHLPGSTPQEPIKHVRTLVVNAFENTTDPQLNYKWLEAQDPGEFRLCHPDYWKEEDNSLGTGVNMKKKHLDACDELDEVQALQRF